MSDKENCSNCAQANDCKTVYEQLGKATGPSIAKKAVAVFLGPIVVFIVCLVILEKRLAVIFGSEGMGIALSVLCAVGVSFLYVLVAKTIIARVGGGQSSCEFRENDDRD